MLYNLLTIPLITGYFKFQTLSMEVLERKERIKHRAQVEGQERAENKAK